MSQRRKYSLIFVSLLLLLLLLEGVSRVALWVMKYPFWQPSSKFYPELASIKTPSIQPNHDTLHILLLGGSAISMEFGKGINLTLDSLLNREGQARKVKIFNAATPAHTSLDNLNKYKLLRDKHFDLVIYYEAINENRANNIPKESFSNDYQHILWYYDMAIMARHPEVNWFTLPFLLDKTFSFISDKIRGKSFMNLGQIEPEYVRFGADIKTTVAFTHNLQTLIQETRRRKEQLLFVTYALYVPPSVIGNGGYTDYRDFAPCAAPSPLHLWGDPINVQKGVNQHNEAMRKLAIKYHIPLFDMAQQMPLQKQNYCDLCHYSAQGERLFAQLLFEYLQKNRLIRK